MRNKSNVITKCTLLGVEVLNKLILIILLNNLTLNICLYFDFKYLQCDVLKSIMWHGEKQQEKFGSYLS